MNSPTPTRIPSPPTASRPASPVDWLEVVRRKIEGLRFGEIQIVVHDGRVTQIERTEKTRLDSPATARGLGA